MYFILSTLNKDYLCCATNTIYFTVCRVTTLKHYYEDNISKDFKCGGCFGTVSIRQCFIQTPYSLQRSLCRFVWHHIIYSIEETLFSFYLVYSSRVYENERDCDLWKYESYPYRPRAHTTNVVVLISMRQSTSTIIIAYYRPVEKTYVCHYRGIPAATSHSIAIIPTDSTPSGTQGQASIKLQRVFVSSMTRIQSVEQPTLSSNNIKWFMSYLLALKVGALRFTELQSRHFSKYLHHPSQPADMQIV